LGPILVRKRRMKLERFNPSCSLHSFKMETSLRRCVFSVTGILMMTWPSIVAIKDKQIPIFIEFYIL